MREREPAPPDVKLLTPQEVALLFRRDVAWVHRARWKLLRPAARKFGPRHLLFDAGEISAIIAKSAENP
jgi:hypothetical protein